LTVSALFLIPLLEKRRLVSITRNSTLNVWEAIAVAPAFSDRVSARQLEAETAQETKKALEELLDSNRDYFDSQPVFSPSKVDPYLSLVFVLL
jgi:hypothetical protein